jgi:CheY-like chemotaxis protein
MVSVFIVDDEELIHRIYTSILSLAGHRVIGNAHNGVEAITKLKELKPPPYLIIMDHRMPLMDGLSATSKLKKFLPTSKILFISADYRMKTRTNDAGADMFLTKPVSLEELLAAVHQLTREQRPDLTS